MKKILALMVFASLLFVACNKEKPEDDPNNNGGSEYVAPITIDGDFADWAKLDAAKVQELKCAAGTTKKDLKLAKIYADKYFVFVYVEFDFTAYDGDVQNVYVDFGINGDNSTETGGYMGPFKQGETPCIDLLTQALVIEEGVVCEAYDAFVGTWSGDVNTDGWSWEECEGLTGFIDGKGTKKAWEFRITRELYPAGKLAKEFTMGVFAMVNGWDATGALPNAEPDEGNADGLANLVTVKYNN